MTAIRKHIKDFIAIAMLLIAGLSVSFYILQEQRLRIPVLEEKPFELKAEFETAQAVVAGQGQSVRVAGVKIGDVQDVSLEDGRAIVTFGLDRSFLPVYEDATLLLRPQTGLKDMFFQLDPGTDESEVIPEGGTVPIENTAPDVNLDEILEALDGDTQAYLRLLLVGAGEGLKGRGKDLGDILSSLGPLQGDLSKLNKEVAKRKQNLANVITNLNKLTGEIGKQDSRILRFVQASNATVGALAERDPDIQRAIRELAPTLQQATTTLTNVSSFAGELGPAFEELRPFARNLEPLNDSVRDLADRATDPIETQIRPLVRSARAPVSDLDRAASRFSKATPKLTVVGRKLNNLGNMAAYNPNGAEPAGTPGRDEGFLYWAGWLGHVGPSVFGSGDAHGFYRRIYLTAGCEQAQDIAAAQLGLGGIISGFGALTGPGGLFDTALGCPA